MKLIAKCFIILSFVLFLGSVPEFSHAQIFDPVFDPGSDSDTPYGICLEAGVSDPEHENFDACNGVDCSNPQDEDEVLKCSSDVNTGTTIAGESLGSTGLTNSSNIGEFIIKLINASLPYLTLAAFLGYLVAGFLYVTALGNDEQLGKAKKILLWSSVGLIIVILSFAITQFFTGDLVEGLNA